MSLEDFIVDLNSENSKISKYFSDSVLLKSALIELRDTVIGQKKIKSQIVKQIKTFVSNKARGIYQEKDLKHCLLYGPPGCGKTMIGKIMCKIWVALGFIGGKKRGSKFASFNKLQDELLRRQKGEIKLYKDRFRKVSQKINETDKVVDLSKKCISFVVANERIFKDKSKYLITELSNIVEIIEKSNSNLGEMITVKAPSVGPLEVEADKNLATTNNDPDLPFHKVGVQDVVSMYVGATSHQCTKTMNNCLDGVAFFDEAYNLCGNSRGLDEGYGKTALTIINEYMTLYPDRLIVVFCGYKKDIEKNLFSQQQGLPNRFKYKFEMEKYTSDELTQIFIKSLKKKQMDYEFYT